MSAHVSLIDDLRTTIRNDSSDRRLETFQRITNLFVQSSGRFSDQQSAVFEQVFLQFVEQVGTDALSKFSVQIADLDSGLQRVVKRLAGHHDIAVAAPLLSRSPQLTTKDLVELAGVVGQSHLLALAGRPVLAENVTDIVLNRGERDVCFGLVCNAGAQISPAGFGRLVTFSARDALLAEKTGLRPDLPQPHLRDLVSGATAAVRRRILALAPAAIKNTIVDLVAAAEESEQAASAKPRDFASAIEMVRNLKNDSKLTEAVLAKLAASRQYEATVVALAALASAPIDVVRPLMRAHPNDGLIVVCKAAELSWDTARAVIMSRFLSTSDTDLDQARLNFGRLSISAAQRMLNAWQFRQTSRDRA